MKAEGKNSDASSNAATSTHSTAEADTGLIISTDPQSSELLEHYERNVAERNAVSLCYQCDRHLHRMSTKLGIHRFQGERLPTKDHRGKLIHCSSCQSDNGSQTTSNMRKGTFHRLLKQIEQ